jgi:RNA-directed DNA polymerase
MDRCHQARVRNALEPEWEARFEPRSYGFRPGRGCHDAIAAIYNVCKGPWSMRTWALDADLAAAFDRIDHDRLLAALGSFPARELIRGWLKAGVFEAGKGFAPTEEGTPQGGVISPCLMNVALHGLEEAAGVRYVTSGKLAGDTRAGSPVLIRYADDMVVLCHTQEQAAHVKARLAQWLAPRGLAFNEDKTRIVRLSEGFDFLGFNIRRYRSKLLIKPSKAAVRRLRERLAADMRTLRGGNAMAVIATLNPIVRGWAAYYRGVVSSRLFHSLDNYIKSLVLRHGRRDGRLCPHPAAADCYAGRTRSTPRRVRVGAVETHLQVGHMAPRQQAEALGRRPVLRQVQQVQERPLGIRRPQQRRLPGQVLLDTHRTARDGQGHGLTR